MAVCMIDDCSLVRDTLEKILMLDLTYGDQAQLGIGRLLRLTRLMRLMRLMGLMRLSSCSSVWLHLTT